VPALASVVVSSLVVTGLLAAAVAAVLALRPAPAGAAGDVTVCHDAALPRQLTEVDVDLAVPRFDPALGTLLEVGCRPARCTSIPTRSSRTRRRPA
jgi:hypothetical protein